MSEIKLKGSMVRSASKNTETIIIILLALGWLISDVDVVNVLYIHGCLQKQQQQQQQSNITLAYSFWLTPWTNKF